jgi:putative peptide zinc metalloprotease protein
MPSDPGSPCTGEHIQNESLKKGPETEEASFVTRSGERYWIIRQTERNTYLRLDERDHFLWTRIDGFHTPSDLMVEYLHRYQALPFGRLEDLVRILTVNGFLCSSRDSAVCMNSTVQGGEGERKRWYEAFWELIVPLPHLNPFFLIFYQKTGWISRIRLFMPCILLVCLGGLCYFIMTEPLPSYPILISGNSDFLTIISIYLIILCSAFLHECGHALACLSYGRSIRDAGLLLYYGSPCLYIDTTDIWMAPRKARIVVSLAGPAVNIFICSLCSLVVMVVPESAFSNFIWRIAFFCYCIALINLNPLLEFDGYYALSDLLEIPDLRSRAFSFIRSSVLSWYTGDQRNGDKNGSLYLLFGISSALFTIVIIFAGIYFWQEHVSNLVSELRQENWEVDKILSTLAIIAIFVPFLVGMLISGSVSLKHRLSALLRG